jgi:hypothetical protein
MSSSHRHSRESGNPANREQKAPRAIAGPFHSRANIRFCPLQTSRDSLPAAGLGSPLRRSRPSFDGFRRRLANPSRSAGSPSLLRYAWFRAYPAPCRVLIATAAPLSPLSPHRARRPGSARAREAGQKKTTPALRVIAGPFLIGRLMPAFDPRRTLAIQSFALPGA